ncbi:hypothetical protein PoB_005268600 [Plakobranchus ocellatus]|uniref:Uncharacterized protein n=1 Tax=Plakobranchus ocellatus TaxID=259542 RepID=A0AAV4C092_9GAST|nr:hypothetical protein PoB_005268600 [Plakobranchus ocellatus]
MPQVCPLPPNLFESKEVTRTLLGLAHFRSITSRPPSSGRRKRFRHPSPGTIRPGSDVCRTVQQQPPGSFCKFVLWLVYQNLSSAPRTIVLAQTLCWRFQIIEGYTSTHAENKDQP